MDDVIAVQNNAPLPNVGEGRNSRGEGDNVIVFIGLGSNLGEREENISNALHKLSGIPEIHVLALSALVDTKPIGPVQNQPDFLNGVVAVKTTLSPLELLDQLLSIETELGRLRRERWGPRIIDLDIIFYGDQDIHHPRLIVPHPEIKNRPFIQKSIDELKQKGIRVPLTPAVAVLSHVGEREV